MLAYLLFVLICVLICRISIRVSFYVLIIGCSVSLLLLPDTGADYGAYKDAYDNAYFTIEYPWFQTASSLTAEPAYKWYTSFFANVIPLGFSSFLMFNFLLCVLLTFYWSKLIPEWKKYIYIFWLYSLPVVFPTIFYWSPRSSISFIMIFGGFLYMLKNEKIMSVILFFCGCSIHSQYLLFSFLIIYTCFSLRLLKPNLYLAFAVCSACALVFVLRSLSEFTQVLSSMLDFMPSSDTITAKMHYFEEEQGGWGYRLTSVLSIFVFPAIAWSLIKNRRFADKAVVEEFVDGYYYLYVFFCIILYGCAINIAFIDMSHLASRLGRFSDYMAMCFLFPLYIRYKFGDNMLIILLLLFCVMAPFIYKGLYANLY